MSRDIDDRLDAALVRYYHRRQALLRELLAGIKPPGGRTGGRSERITPEQYDIISTLDAYGHGVTVKEIVEAIVTPHANVTRTLERLERKGLIYRTRGSEDRRQVIVRLTLAGSKLARQLKRTGDDLYRRLWGGLDEHEKRMMLDLLSR